MSFGNGVQPTPWRNPKIALVILLVFLCGAMAGAVAARYRYRGVPVAKRPAASWTEAGREISVERFRKELDLTESQTAEVAEVLDDFMKYYQTLQAQMDDVRVNGKDRIVGILNPGQREKFTRMMSELQAKQRIK